MPVKKVRSIEEMDTPVWRQPGDPMLYRTMAALWDLGHRTRRKAWPPGVTKFASIEELNRALTEDRQ